LLPASPFGTDRLSQAWPLLLECCSLPHSPAKISALLAEVRDVDWLFRFADEHGVIGHLVSAIALVPETRIPDLLLKALRDRHRQQSLFTLTMAAELFRIRDLLCQSSIEFAVVKGPVLALRAYGDPAARSYLDLDMLVCNADIPRAVALLVAAGYESRIPIEAIHAGKIPGQYLFRGPRTNTIFELHTERTLRYFPFPLPIERYFKRRTSLLLDGQPVPALCLEDELVLISIHGAKHFWERLMWISDIAAVVHHHPELDWKCIELSAAEVGAERMLRLALLLAERLLRAPLPAQMKDQVMRDSVCARLAAQIETWLPFAGCAAPPVAQRAFFRFRVAGSGIAGASYLARLSFSPTEEDWLSESDGTAHRFAEILGRPFRLTKKYRRPEL
jgi:hypothetical protein